MYNQLLCNAAYRSGRNGKTSSRAGIVYADLNSRTIIEGKIILEKIAEQ